MITSLLRKLLLTAGVAVAIVVGLALLVIIAIAILAIIIAIVFLAIHWTMWRLLVYYQVQPDNTVNALSVFFSMLITILLVHGGAGAARKRD